MSALGTLTSVGQQAHNVSMIGSISEAEPNGLSGYYSLFMNTTDCSVLCGPRPWDKGECWSLYWTVWRGFLICIWTGHDKVSYTDRQVLYNNRPNWYLDIYICMYTAGLNTPSDKGCFPHLYDLLLTACTGLLTNWATHVWVRS